MSNQFILTTARLSITPLSLTDADFIFELLNTEGWIKFIGNRNVTSAAVAEAYIQKILNSENLSYWLVKLKNSREEIGIVTYVKRNYLEHHDIGFAFLPGYYKQGFAFEATTAVLDQIVREQNILHILATTVPANERSIKLLERIGLVFETEIEIENQKLHVYGASTDKLVS